MKKDLAARLPDFDDSGNLPAGIYPATLEEIAGRFGGPNLRRSEHTRRLAHLCELAVATGCLSRFIIFGSYVTTKPEPNDLDLVLVMADDFQPDTCPLASRGLFSHAVAQARHEASVFWIRPAHLGGVSLEEYMELWQTCRDGSRRGIIEVVR